MPAKGLRSNATTIDTRQLSAPATGPAPDTAGPTGTLPLANVLSADDLKAIEALTGTSGLLAKTAANTWALRTITGTADQVTVTNGAGIAGNPTLSLPQSIATTSIPQFAGLGIGKAGSSAVLDMAGTLAVTGNGSFSRDTANTTFQVQTHRDAASFAIILGQHSRGTQATPLATQSGDGMLFRTQMHEGTAYQVAVEMQFRATENHASGSRGAYWGISTVLTAAATLAERMRMSGAGNLLIGGTSDTGLTGAGGSRIFSTTEATASAGALIVDGGALVKKALFVNSATEAATTPAGSIVTAGGIYAAKKIITGSDLTTDAPDASGSAAAAWKLGDASPASPVSNDRLVRVQVGTETIDLLGVLVS